MSTISFESTENEVLDPFVDVSKRVLLDSGCEREMDDPKFTT